MKNLLLIKTINQDKLYNSDMSENDFEKLLKKSIPDIENPNEIIDNPDNISIDGDTLHFAFSMLKNKSKSKLIEIIYKPQKLYNPEKLLNSNEIYIDRDPLCQILNKKVLQKQSKLKLIQIITEMDENKSVITYEDGEYIVNKYLPKSKLTITMTM